MCSTSQLSTNSPTKTDELNVQQCDAGVVMEHYFPWVLEKLVFLTFTSVI